MFREKAYEAHVDGVPENLNPWVYDGPQRLVGPRCWHCKSANCEVNYIACNKCRLAHYCSEACRNANLQHHASLCNLAVKAADNVNSAETSPDPNNPMKYYEALNAKVDLLFGIPAEFKCCYFLEEDIRANLKLLKVFGNQPMYGDTARSSLVFKMLRLNKDEECYSFIKWHLTVAPSRWNKGMEDVSTAEWIYLENQNVFEDIFEIVPYSNGNSVNSSFLLGLSIIKLRLASFYKAVSARWNAFLELRLLDGFGLVLLKIEEYLCGTSFYGFAQRFAPQEELAKRWLTILHNHNKLVLPGLFNKNFLLHATISPDANHKGVTAFEEEAWFAAVRGHQYVKRAPWAKDTVEAVLTTFGPTSWDK